MKIRECSKGKCERFVKYGKLKHGSLSNWFIYFIILHCAFPLSSYPITLDIPSLSAASACLKLPLLWATSWAMCGVV